MALEQLRGMVTERPAALTPSVGTQEGPKRDETAPAQVDPLEREKREIEALKQQLAGAYKAYQENIRHAGQLRAEIIKGTKAGDPVHDLLLKAIKCIGLMTGEEVTYKTCKRELTKRTEKPQ